MPHVVTQSCCSDASCVWACPVNCIQPTPDDPDFARAEMLHIDPVACVDCGACVSACPVDAIKPESRLEPHERAFLELSRAYHGESRPRPRLAPPPRRLTVRRSERALRVAVVGSGPAGMYAAEHVLTIPGARVELFERLAEPYGLARFGVAPDHRETRRVTRQFEATLQSSRLRLITGVEVGGEITHDELLAGHDAVIYAVGAAGERRLGVPGAELASTATDVVAWYNGHPDAAGRRFDLASRRAVIVGNGNVALDVARILTLDPDRLADSDIDRSALAALRHSRIEEVVVVGRRGPESAAFTLPELVGLAAERGISLSVRPEEIADAGPAEAKLALLHRLPSAAAAGAGRRIVLRFGLSPERVLGRERAEGIVLRRADGGTETLPAGLVLTSIGYRGRRLPDLPFDAARGTVPHAAGRVIDPASGMPVPGAYVAGWIKRGPSGFIGTNRLCALETVESLVADRSARRPERPRRTEAVPALGRAFAVDGVGRDYH